MIRNKLSSLILTFGIVGFIFFSCTQTVHVSVSIDDIPKPPVAKIENVTETIHGITLEDPYRYMEDLKDSSVIDWIKEQNNYTREVLNRIPIRNDLEERMRELIGTTPSNISRLKQYGNLFFFMKRNKDEELSKLYYRKSIEGEDILLVDPMEFQKGEEGHYSMNYFSPSWDGSKVAFGVSQSGSENATLRVMDVGTGNLLAESIDRVQFGIISWTKDNLGFFYNRLNKADSQMMKYANSKTFYHNLGDDIGNDIEVFSNQTNRELNISSSDFPVVLTSKNSDKLFGLIIHGVDNRLTLFITDLDDEIAVSKNWKLVFDVEDEVSNFDIYEDDIFCLSYKDAPRFKVIKTSLSSPDISNAEIIIPEGEGVVKTFTVAKDGLYSVISTLGICKIYRQPYGDMSLMEEIELPVQGTAELAQVDVDYPGIIFAQESWVEAYVYYKYDPGKNKVIKTNIQPQSPYGSPKDLVAEKTMVVSYDSTEVPLTIIHKKGIELDSNHPTILYAYGSYGMTEDPYFSFIRYLWLEKGGVYAIAHVRGGGILGEEWHLSGMKKTKPNTWKDFIACAEYLIDNGYTSPGKLGSMGGSAGGITVGRSMLERPDLFKAVISIVGSSNLTRIGSDPNGPPNYPEFGNPENPEEFKYLYEMDSYQHVVDGTNYPAVMLTGGINDPRVIAWIPSKMTARMQAASVSENPILLRMDFEAGHGIGNTLTQSINQYADIYAFLLWQFDEIYINKK